MHKIIFFIWFDGHNDAFTIYVCYWDALDVLELRWEEENYQLQKFDKNDKKITKILDFVSF